MDHAPRVGVGDGLADLLEDGEETAQVLCGVGPLLQQGGEGPALDQPHREVGPQVGIEPQLIHREDAGMLELAADLGLLDEPLDHRRVPGMARVEHLHRDVPAEVGVAPLEDDAHPAAGDLAMDVVAPRPAGGEPASPPGRGSDHRRRRVGLVAQQDPRRDAAGLPEGVQHAARSPMSGRGRGPEGGPQGRVEGRRRTRRRRASDRDRQGRSWYLPSRSSGPHPGASPRAAFAPVSSENPAGADSPGLNGPGGSSRRPPRSSTRPRRASHPR